MAIACSNSNTFIDGFIPYAISAQIVVIIAEVGFKFSFLILLFAVFTTGIPHPTEKKAKFINFEDDGYEVKKHLGLVETERAKDKRQYLLDCWHGKITDFPSSFMVDTTVENTDEWIHSFYYYNDEIPTEEDFMNSIGDYLTFEFNMITHGKGYLFEQRGDAENA